MNGTHRIDLANEQERIKYLESIGGEENLKNKFPLLYRSFLDVCDSNDDIDNVTVVFQSHDFNCERTNHDKDAYRIRVTLKGDYFSFVATIVSGKTSRLSAYRCHAKDNKISLADGTVKHAEEIKEGDILPCFGGKNLEVDNIYKGHEDSIFQVTTKHGEKTKISRGHPLLLEGGMGMEVERLNSGDRILMDGNTSAEVESVELIPYNDKVFNFTFKDEEGANYLVADGFYSGDFYAQNMLPIPKRPITKHHAAIIEEMRRLAENI